MNKKGDKKPLSKAEIDKGLKELPGWSFAHDKISKEFKFPGFVDVVDLVNKLMPFCEENDHHPDIHIYYNRVVFELQRFDIGGKVTALDFLIAKEIERLYERKTAISS